MSDDAGITVSPRPEKMSTTDRPQARSITFVLHGLSPAKERYAATNVILSPDVHSHEQKNDRAYKSAALCSTATLLRSRRIEIAMYAFQ